MYTKMPNVLFAKPTTVDCIQHDITAFEIWDSGKSGIKYNLKTLVNFVNKLTIPNSNLKINIKYIFKLLKLRLKKREKILI